MTSRPPIPKGPYLIVGLARSGLAAMRVLRARGEQVIGVDGGRPAAARALADAGVEVHLGSDGVAQLARASVLVKSPGVPAQAPVVAVARERGIPVLGELEFAWRLLANEFIAVTGTNGKTTTVHWIGHIHREAGLPVAVAGNVGDPLSGLVEHVDSDATVVCEVSSFQLEDTLAFAPEAAVLLNFSADHLDRHGTLDAYREAKLQIFARQRAGDLAVLPCALAELRPHDAARLVRFGEGAGADCGLRDGRLWWGEQPLLATTDLALPGAHNAENALAAAAVCLARGIDPEAVRAGLRSFAGVAHRLEEVTRRDGVLYVNDSKATNIASTRVALAAFPHAGVHVILGGQAKGQDFTTLREPVRERCRAVYLIGEDAALIAQGLAGIAVPVTQCGELEHAVSAATVNARPGEVVLLSPACASFDQFADFEARGTRFRELVTR